MDFESFWPRYLRAHSQPRTRQLHIVGTIAGSALVLAAIVLRRPWLAALGLVSGYGPAWFSHATVEHNKPETFKAPFASLAADYLMVWHALRGTLDEEIARNGSPYHA